MEDKGRRYQQRGPAVEPAADEGIDFDIILNDSRLEQDADSTYRPNIKPTDAIGSQFEPFHVPEHPFEVHDLPVSPLKLFQHFLPIWLVESWVDYTNRNPGPDGRMITTAVSEIYIWIAMIIYMDLNPRKSYRDYWKGPTAGENASTHRIARYMSFDRFSLLKRRLRIDDPDTIDMDVPDPYNKVNEWANVMMDAALSIVTIGSIIGVDEAMQAFQGRSKQKVTIKGKPTPTGLKIWVLAVAGYMLQWLWHRLGCGPVGIEGCRGPRKARNKVTSSDGSSDKAPASPKVLIGV
jgi:hypothetical protein